jgi:hypothetical protein
MTHIMKLRTNSRPGALSLNLLMPIVVLMTITCACQAQSQRRPLSDFLNAQGSTTCFTPPAPAQLGWATGPGKTNGNANLTPPRFALIDYTGLEAKFLLDNYGINLGTTVTGTVMERALADGHALVTVDLHTRNAMGWAFNSTATGGPNDTPLAFGARVLDVVNGAAPALGNVHFHIEFVNSAPGAPLPDVVAVNEDPVNCPGPFVPPLSYSEVDFLSIEASITGILHAPSGFAEGTPGMLAVKQIGLLSQPPRSSGPLRDQFPVESIDLKPIGR